MTDILFHISDRPDIARFEPRPAPPSSGQTGQMVWAVGQRLLHNYLLPRDCPRVTFYARFDSLPEDIERLMSYSSARYVVAIESGWLPEVIRHLFRLLTSSARSQCYRRPSNVSLIGA